MASTKAPKKEKMGTLSIIIKNTGEPIGPILVLIEDQQGTEVFEDFITKESHEVKLPNGFYRVDAPLIVTSLLTDKKYRLKRLNKTVAPNQHVVVLSYVLNRKQKTKKPVRS